MKSAEKKLHSAVRNGNLVSPLLLDEIKEKIASSPVETQAVKQAKRKRIFKRSAAAIFSAGATAVVCYLSIFVFLIFFAPANSAPPGHSDGSGQLLMSIAELSEKIVPDITPAEYAENEGLELFLPYGDGKLIKLTNFSETLACKSVFEADGITLTVIQTLKPFLIREFETFTEGSAFATYTYRYNDGQRVIFDIFPCDDGLVSKTLFDDGNVLYLTIDNRNTEDLISFIEQIVENSEKYHQ